MVSAPARSAPPPTAVARPCVAPVRVLLPDGALAWEDLAKLRDDNPGYRFERYGRNELVITMGSGRKSDVRAARIVSVLITWSDAVAGGDVAASSAISEAEDGSWLIADASWMSDERMAASGGENGEGPGAIPELVVEVMSWTDDIADQQEKMERWIARGVLLGWLIDPYERIVWIYRPGREVEELHEPADLRGDPELPGLVVPMDNIWAPRDRDDLQDGEQG